MEICKYPSEDKWPALLSRPETDGREIAKAAREIMDLVRKEGDSAVRELTARFDGYKGDLRVSLEEIAAAEGRVAEDLKQAIETAGANIRRFHEAQDSPDIELETFPGVVCGTRKVPIAKVGIYVPGGTAPLFSTVMMLAIPANIAGCREIAMCTPPGPDGSVHDAILYAAKRFGVTDVFRIGGAQAVAAMAYGTETVPKVDKIFGPGNRYVTAAKMLAAAEGAAIDMPAGPSEVAVIADGSSDPRFVAADLLAQAEHGTDSQVMLITDSGDVARKVNEEIEKQIAALPRRDIAAGALENSRAVVLTSIGEAVRFANEYAAEHLIISTEDADAVAEDVTCAGSVFIGKYSCESAGDYASGTNHTLPTNGFARAFSGVSLDSFRKQITYQKISAEGILGLGPFIETLAEAEELAAHRNAVTVRIKEARGRLAKGAGGKEDAG
ncbi:MAG: histidinol dehydrogenase [Acidobacteriota bacterium]|nr:MAG: histidinol dehydrogenase [Acidobacteriota bacterium]